MVSYFTRRVAHSGLRRRSISKEAAVRLETLEDRRVLAVTFGPGSAIIQSNSVYPKSVVSADFDGDNDADIVVASLVDDKVSWYENLDGRGTYGEQRVITTTSIGASAVHAADMDGDGDFDILSASASTYDSDVSWYENIDGRGTFSEQRIISAEISVADSVFAADLDSDGDLDVLSASRADAKVAWYENLDGQGDFGGQIIISDVSEGATTVYAADLDGDGDVDVVAGSVYDNTIAWFENTDGNASFFHHIVTDQAVFVTAVYVADLDQDGDPDIVSASRDDNTISWFPNDGSAQFGAERIISVDERGPNELFIGDVDGDNDLDVVSATRVGDRIAWYANDGRGVFGPPNVVSEKTEGASSVFAVDVDGDSDLDLFSTSRWDNKVALYENLDGAGGFGSQQVLTTEGAPGTQFAVAADVDGDGDNDVLTAAFATDSLLWSENLGRGVFGPTRLISDRANGAEVVVPADFDGDGDIDVASASYFDSKIAWYENVDGRGTFGVQRVVTIDAVNPEFLHAADIDGDGDIDLLSASRYDDKIAWYANDGQGMFGPQQFISSSQAGPTIVTTADLDGDGDLDVMANAYDGNTISWYENVDGAGNFGSENIITSILDIPTAVAAADLDGDGDLDAVSTSGNDDLVAWYENTDGAGSFGAPRVISRTADGAFHVDPADFDGDGDIDLLVASILDDTVGWYENVDGKGTFNPLVVISTSSLGPTSVDAADLDGDGFPDAIVSGSLSDDVIWFRNTRDGDLAGDFDGDSTVDEQDIELLCSEIRDGGFDDAFDLDGDGVVDTVDLNELIVGILGTNFGDANLDGVFDSSDIVQVFQRGQYEDETADNSSWGDGDWNCDGEFTSNDLVVAFQSGAFESASRAPDRTIIDRAAIAGVLHESSSVDESAESLGRDAEPRPDHNPTRDIVQPRPRIRVLAADGDLHRSARDFEPIVAAQPTRELLEVIDAAYREL